MNNIQLSVIIPIYNVEKYLAECLDSVFKIKHDNWEIILVNDGSTDGSLEIAKKYIKYQNTVLISQNNRGLSAARNAGMKKAKGDYLFFLDSDDYINIESLEAVLNDCSKHDLDIAVGRGLVELDVSDKRQVISEINCYGIKEHVVYSGNDFLKEQLKNGTFQTVVWLYIYKKAFIEQNNYQFREGFLHEDEIWTPIVLLKAKKIMLIDKVFYIYRKRKESITTKQKSSKNFKDLSIIRNELREYYSDVNDNELKELLLDDLVKRRLYDYAICKNKNAMKEKHFFNLYSKSWTNKIKSTILISFPSLYFYFFDLTHQRRPAMNLSRKK